MGNLARTEAIGDQAWKAMEHYANEAELIAGLMESKLGPIELSDRQRIIVLGVMHLALGEFFTRQARLAALEASRG